jgi:hypothetical protein
MKIILTGTRAYGPKREDSDWDFVMEYLFAARVRQMIEKAGIETVDNSDINPEYKGFTFEIYGIQIQVICANDEDDLNAWEYATKKMYQMHPIKNREERIKTFRKFHSEYERK